jgi:hypothetical protein
MALKISIQTSNIGVSFTDAYARITNIFANKDQCQYQVAVYATEDARQANAQDVAQHAYYCATPQGNLMEGLYADLKLQPGFETAEDC